MNRLALSLVWIASAAAAVGLVWLGVSQVASRVVEPLPPAAVSSVVSPTATPSPTPTTDPTAVPTPASPTSPSGTPDPTSTQAVEVRSYDLVGGTATIRFSPTSVEVLSASPKPGFTLEPIDRSDPRRARVEFEGESHRSRLEARWQDGPAAKIDEDD